jgi:hypothetical protein
MTGFIFSLKKPDGSPPEPPTLSAAVPNWSPGDMIHLGHRTLRVLERRDDHEAPTPVLIVEDVAE